MPSGLPRFFRAAWLCSTLLLLEAGIVTPACGQILQNGGMESSAEGGRGIAGWTTYRWEGEGQVVHSEGTAFAGRRAAIVQGSGPGKIALYQEVMLPACTYRLSAMVAGYDLAPGTWDRGAQLHVAFDDGSSLTHPVLKSDSGWRRMSLSFGATANLKAIIYFFNYGSGGFFVDDVRLEADQPCGTTPAGFSVAMAVSAPLDYTPPMTVEDRLLAGYCNRDDFAGRAVCKRIAAAPRAAAAESKRATEPLVLADFASRLPFHKPSLMTSWRSWRLHTQASSGRRTALLPAAASLVGEPSTGLRESWAGYDWLEIDVENGSEAPHTLTIEIRDDKTTDYWSRVNWSAAVPPGRSTAYVPLKVFVGEKSVIKERRRLDVTRITKLVLSNAETAPDLVIEALRLVPEPPLASDFPELIKLDAGPVAGSVLSGFTALLPSTRYRPERGYGLSPDAKIGRVEDRRHPDDLLRDWISFNAGGLDIDLPNDTYRVWMMLEDPGYWEYYPSFTRRLVFAEGRTVLDDRRGAQDFLERYFRHADEEDWPGDDIWRRYVATRYRPLEFDVEVRDGQLNIRFESGQDPHAVPLSALLIYPKSQSIRGGAYIAELWGKLARDFAREHRQVPPPLSQHAKPRPNALDGALSVFQRPIERPVHATDWPATDELVSSLSLTLAGDERAVLMLGLYAHSELVLTGATLEPAGIEPTPLLVRYKHARANQDGTSYSVVPRVLDPLRVAEDGPLVLPAGRARSIWFDLHAPAGAAPGRRDGRLRLRFAGGLSHDLPVVVDLAPWRLPPADIPVGYLGVAPTYPTTTYREVSLRRVSDMSAALRLLRSHGFTAISGGLNGPVFQGYASGRMRMDYMRADRSMEIIGAIMRPPEVGTYGGLELGGLPLDVRHDTVAEYGKPYAHVLNDVLMSIKEHGEARGWPTLVHAIGDEPSGDDVERVAAVGRLFRESPAKVRSAVFTSLRSPGDEPTAKLAGAVDRLYLNLHSEQAIRYVRNQGSECALYNQEGRYRRGIYLFKMKALGCRGHLSFALSSVHADPWYDLDGREADYSAVFTHPDGQLRLSVDFLRYREAINDYRYLLRLEQAIAAAAPGDAARADAKRWLDNLVSSMRGDSGSDDGWSSARLGQVRQQSIEHLRRLRLDDRSGTR